MSTDAEGKAIAAGAQLQQALQSAADALKTIASALPFLLPQRAQAPVLSSGPTVAISTETMSAPHKRKRKEKDPEAPEKPVSAYHLWSKGNRDRIKASMPGDPSASDVLTELNRLWKGLADEAKKVRFPFHQASVHTLAISRNF
jgi:HMG (high mobility group) box